MCERIEPYMPPLCHCGCGEYVEWRRDHKKWNKHIRGHSNRGADYNERINAPQPYCACGCGELSTWSKSGKRWNEYIFGHYVRTEKHKETSRKTIKQRFGNEEVRKEYSERARQFYKDNPDIRERQTKDLIEKYKDPEYKERVRLATKQVYEDPVLRERAGERSRERWEDPEYRERNINAVKQAYIDNPELKQQNSLSKIKVYKDKPELIEQKRITTKLKWDDPEYREKTTDAIRKSYENNPARREKLSLIHTKRYEDNPDIKERISRKSKEMWKNPEYAAKMKALSIERWKDPEYISKMLVSQKRLPNKPEQVVNAVTPDNVRYVGNKAWHRALKILDENGNWITKYKNPDFKITGQNKVIEVFGDYWHKDDDPNVWHEAWAKAGFELLVIWEHEIYEDLTAVLDRIAKFIEQDNWQYNLPLTNPAVLKKIKQ